MRSLLAMVALSASISTTLAADAGVPGPWSVNDPLVTIQNISPKNVCYKIEFSSKSSFPTTTTCDNSPGVLIPAGQTISFHAGVGFNGAITAITDGIKGARHEINCGQPGITWYDVDYELGMSDSTLGPSDHRQRINGLPSLHGEQDTLAKANAAWPSTKNKGDLLAHSDYIKQGSDGKLSHVYMDSMAPEVVSVFFQLTADFTAYVGPGSVNGAGVGPNTIKDLMTKAADQKTWSVNTQQMTITVH